MSKASLANCFLEFDFGARKEGLIGLVSEQGVVRVQFSHLPYTNIASLSGKLIEITIGGRVKVKGRMYKEYDEAGSYYSVLFERITEKKRNAIGKVIRMQRFAAPWERKQVRFHGTTDSPAVELPEQVKIEVEGKHPDVRVLNFSRDGMQIKAAARANLQTSHGELLQDLEARIVRVTEDHNVETNETAHRYGVCFARLGRAGDKYLSLIDAAEARVDTTDSVMAA